jgi:hypothetical protein
VTEKAGDTEGSALDAPGGDDGRRDLAPELDVDHLVAPPRCPMTDLAERGHLDRAARDDRNSVTAQEHVASGLQCRGGAALVLVQARLHVGRHADADGPERPLLLLAGPVEQGD